MFLTTPECILKSSSYASVSKDFFPSLTSFFFQAFQRRPNFYPIRLSLLFLNYFYSRFNMWHSAYDDLLTLSLYPPPSPYFLNIAAPRSCACWILLEHTHQLATSPCPLESHLRFSGAHWCLDTPAVGSLMMSCLPYAHNTDACGSGATAGSSTHH